MKLKRSRVKTEDLSPYWELVEKECHIDSRYKKVRFLRPGRYRCDAPGYGIGYTIDIHPRWMDKGSDYILLNWMLYKDSDIERLD